MQKNPNWPMGIMSYQTLSEFTGSTKVQVRKIIQKYEEAGAIFLDENKNIFIKGSGEVPDR